MRSTTEPPGEPPQDTPSGSGGRSLHNSLVIHDSLLSEEAARARSIGLVYCVIGLVTAMWVPFLSGRHGFACVVTVVMLVFGVSSLVFAAVAWRESRYSPLVFRVYGVIAVTTSTVILAYLGVFSPTALAVTLGIAFFGAGADRVGAWFISMSAIVAYLVLLILVSAGIVADPGIFQGSEAGVTGRWFMVMMVPLVLFVTFLQARMSRRAIIDAVDKAVQAAELAEARGAQIAEVRQELDRVIAAGRKGRYSGQRVGCYQVGDLIGRGGLSEVYVGQRVGTTSPPVAVKILHRSALEEPEMVQRFQREARLAMRVDSRHCVRVLDQGTAEDGALYLGMELLQGEDLGARLRKEQRMTPEECVPLASQAAVGLQAVHDAGIVHRDIKPSNLFYAVGADGDARWVVLDFGICKEDGGTGTLTQVNAVGTPAYMSPEQARGEVVDGAADVYALGAVVYRAITGRPPHTGPNVHVVLFSAAHRRPPRPRDIQRKVPRDVEAVLAIAMAHSPAQRFDTVSGFANALDAAVHGRLAPGISARGRSLGWGRAE